MWLIVYFLKERVGPGALPSPHSVANGEGEERLQVVISAAQDLSAPTAIRQQGAACHHLPPLIIHSLQIACLVLDPIWSRFELSVDLQLYNLLMLTLNSNTILYMVYMCE